MRSIAAALLVSACLASSPAAHADGPPVETHAHDAYERGTAAYRRGDYATAAREYAAADALAPNPVALQAAIDATVQGDDPVFGTTLLERARGEPRTDALVTSMLTAERKFAHRVGRIRLECPAPPCLGAIDGVAAVAGEAVIVRVGAHAVTLEGSGAVVKRVVTVGPDETFVFAPEAVPVPPAVTPPPPVAAPPPRALPPPLPRPRETAHPGLSPVWFYAGLGATAVAGGLTIASGVDTANHHASFSRSCVVPEAAADCSQLQTQGRDAQTRTNVLLGVTAGLGAVTVVTAFFVRWHDASLSVGTGTLRFDARF